MSKNEKGDLYPSMPQESSEKMAGAPPDNPPPYTFGPAGQTGYPSGPPGPMGFTAGPQGPTPYPTGPQGSAPYPTGPQGSAPYSDVPPGSGVYVAQGPQVIVGGLPPGTYVQPVLVQQMGSRPANITCKSCNQEIITRVESRATVKTHLFALILCVIGCWPLACVPYCMDSCNNVDHYCTNCNSYIGSYVN